MRVSASHDARREFPPATPGRVKARLAALWQGGAASLAVLCVTCLLFPFAARADADGPDFFVVVGVADDDVLNIRADPGADAEQVGEIPPGAACVRNLGCRGGLSFEEFTTLSEEEKAERLKHNPRWCRVEFEGTIGWVAGRYLAEGSCARAE